MELTAVGEHEQGAMERFAFVSSFPTHAETWSIAQTDHLKGDEAFRDGFNNYLKSCGFVDRDGNWWVIWHSFVHTDSRAREWLAQHIDDVDGWGDANLWTGELSGDTAYDSHR